MIDDLEVHTGLSQHHDQANIILQSSEKDGLFIAAFFPKEITIHLAEENPLHTLSFSNLNDFWVVVEETSHFHLITQRGHNNNATKKLELEMQGEIDKILVAALLLHQQSGHHHIPHLWELLFERSTIISEDQSHYKAAHKWAAYFWKIALEKGLGNLFGFYHEPFRSFMQNNYRKDLSEKWNSLLSTGKILQY